MILVTTEQSPSLAELRKLPESRRAEQVLSPASFLINKGSVYGKITNVIWVYGDFGSVRKLNMKKYTGDLIFVCDYLVLGAFSRYLKTSGFEIIEERLTRENILTAVMKRYSCQKVTAEFICDYFKYSLRTIVKNDDAIFDFMTMQKPLTVSRDWVSATYAEALYFLAGDDKVSRECFLEIIEKYKFSGRHIIKFIRKHLKLFIDLYFDDFTGELKIDSQEYRIVARLSDSLNIERAVKLYKGLDGCTCIDLLKIV